MSCHPFYFAPLQKNDQIKKYIFFLKIIFPYFFFVSYIFRRICILQHSANDTTIIYLHNFIAFLLQNYGIQYEKKYWLVFTFAFKTITINFF